MLRTTLAIYKIVFFVFALSRHLTDTQKSSEKQKSENRWESIRYRFCQPPVSTRVMRNFSKTKKRKKRQQQSEITIIKTWGEKIIFKIANNKDYQRTE